jgi:hypothetical protein
MRHIALICCCILASCAGAQWTVVRLHPDVIESYAFGVNGNHQAGKTITIEDVTRAALWNGSAGSWVDLHPAGANWSEARATAGGQQAGAAGDRACIWTGTAASIVYLQPLGVDRSFAYSTDGTHQAGFVETAKRRKASLWSGTAVSLVNLDPHSSVRSEAYAVADGQQVGYAFLGSGTSNAILWKGTAASYVNLHPPGNEASVALDVSNGRQVGYTINCAVSRAALWSGTAASWVDLHPLSVIENLSQVHGIYGDNQVGVVYVDSMPRASFWTGTKASWIDLGQFVSAPLIGASVARDIHTEGAITRVVGYAIHNEIGWEAVMWTSRAVAPISFARLRGVITGGNLASLIASDNDRLTIGPGTVFSSAEPPIQVRIDSTAPAPTPNGIMFSVETSASFGNAQQKIWLWNYVDGEYELMDTRLATLNDDVTNVIVRNNSSRFIQPGTLSMRALLTFKALGPAFSYPWSSRIDRVWWTFPG